VVRNFLGKTLSTSLTGQAFPLGRKRRLNYCFPFNFILAPRGTQAIVTNCISEVRVLHPIIDVMTMSSTYLPWLKSFFESETPDVLFLDPAESKVASAIRIIESA
jgi:hypothetical protein